MLKQIFIIAIFTIFSIFNASAQGYTGTAYGVDIDLLAGSATNLGKIVNGKVVTANSQGSITNLNKLNATGTITTVGNIIGTTGIFSKIYVDTISGGIIPTNTVSASAIISTSTITYAHFSTNLQLEISNSITHPLIFYTSGTRAMSNNLNMGGYAITNAHSLTATNSIVLSGINTVIIYTNGAVDTVALSVVTTLQFLADFEDTFLSSNRVNDGYRARLLKTPGDFQNLGGFLLGRPQISEDLGSINSYNAATYAYYYQYVSRGSSGNPFLDQFEGYSISNANSVKTEIYVHPDNTNFARVFENPGITNINIGGITNTPAYAAFVPRVDKTLRLAPSFSPQSFTSYPPFSVTYDYTRTNGQYGITPSYSWGTSNANSYTTNTIVPTVENNTFLSNITYKIVSIRTNNTDNNGGWVASTNLNFDIARVINLTNSTWTGVAGNITGITSYCEAYASTASYSNKLPRNLWLYASNATFVTISAFFGNETLGRLPSGTVYTWLKFDAQIWKTNQYYVRSILNDTLRYNGGSFAANTDFNKPQSFSFMVPPDTFWRVLAIHNSNLNEGSLTNLVTVKLNVSN